MILIIAIIVKVFATPLVIYVIPVTCVMMPVMHVILNVPFVICATLHVMFVILAISAMYATRPAMNAKSLIEEVFRDSIWRMQGPNWNLRPGIDYTKLVVGNGE